MKNYVRLIGVLAGLEESHEMDGERYYKSYLFCQRASRTIDIIPLVISEYVHGFSLWDELQRVEIVGEVRSRNTEHKVELYVYVDSIARSDVEDDVNEIYLEGTICKSPVYRQTPQSREITDLCISVRRNYGKRDFVNCIVWGKSARRIYHCDLYTEVSLSGRFQSREYNKDGMIHTAYEISVINIEEAIDG